MEWNAEVTWFMELLIFPNTSSSSIAGFQSRDFDDARRGRDFRNGWVQNLGTKRLRDNYCLVFAKVNHKRMA
ncbi:hypothetical protein ATANTOWER_031441 [Ataeniobius toweri]|uniref:Uncharacterized protein n=1 Tax=Ataeniobius toweri TaxID=208326 RepID=A0ABU7B2N1_9TELE|nr:hypothetical protein [Ataeniobius toweri]